MRFGYAAGHDAGFAAAVEIYERQIAVLREEMSDLRAQLDTANARVEGAVDQLLVRMGARAITPRALENEEKRYERQDARMRELFAQGDPTADRPLGTPGSEFDQPNDPRADLLYDGDPNGIQ